MKFEREPLTREERTRLEAACESGRDKLVVWTLLDTGLRLSEFATLKSEAVDWQGRRMVIWGKAKIDPACKMCQGRGKLKGGGKCPSCGKRRVVPITERVVAVLSRRFADSDGVGVSARTIDRVIKRVANRAGVAKKASPHVLRHTFATHALQRGVSLPALRAILGHESLTTTQIYLNMSGEEAVREFKEKVG